MKLEVEARFGWEGAPEGRGGQQSPQSGSSLSPPMTSGRGLIFTAKHGAAHGSTTVEHEDLSAERQPRLISAP